MGPLKLRHQVHEHNLRECIALMECVPPSPFPFSCRRVIYLARGGCRSCGVSIMCVSSRDFRALWTPRDLETIDLIVSAGGRFSPPEAGGLRFLLQLLTNRSRCAGDGTFLDSASKVTHKRLPIIGLNTDPEKLVFFLSLACALTLKFILLFPPTFL